MLAAAAVLIAGSFSSAMTGVLRSASPTAALHFSSTDPVALVKDIDNVLADEGAALVKSGKLGRSADLSLRGTAMNPGALRLLAIDADSKGQIGRSTSLLLMSEKLSRREVGTQLILLEKSVEGNDVSGTLVHYDRLLRTSRLSQDLLFPMFNQAAVEPEVATHIGRLFMTDPPWLGAFLDWTIYDAPEIGNLARMFPSIPARSNIWTDDRKRGLITKFVSQGENVAAFNLYRSYTRVKDRSPIRDGAFRQTPQYPPIDWAYGNSPDLSAYRADSSDGGVEYNASMGAGGVALTQLIALPQGKYGFAVMMSHDARDRAETPRWTISCYGKLATVLMSSDVAQARSGATILHRQHFQIPANQCAYQWLRLEIRPTNNASGQSGIVRKVAIEAVS